MHDGGNVEGSTLGVSLGIIVGARDGCTVVGVILGVALGIIVGVFDVGNVVGAADDAVVVVGALLGVGAYVDTVTFRIRLFWRSAMYKFPEESTATSCGLDNSAEVAGPPSPLKLLEPTPATVEMIPVDTVTLRIRLLLLSATYTLPI